MSLILSQNILSEGNQSIGVTEVRLTARSDTVTLPRMTAASGKVIQLRRSGDPTVTVSQTNSTAVALTGNTGDTVLLFSQHAAFIPAPASG